MPSPLAVLTTPRVQVLLIGIAAAGLAVGGFETGRKTVAAATIAESMATTQIQPIADPVLHKERLLERDHRRINVREIATVPFSQLYDVLRSSSREQLLAWARDLEQMPRGPRQRAAVTAYYKSLIQVDHHAAIEAVLRAENLNMRDVAIVSLMKAAPESVWGDLAEMIEQLRHPRRFGSVFPQDIIWNWSRVDPVAASKFIEAHPTNGDDSRLYSLFCNWSTIDPAAAREWLEGDASRQTKDAFRAFLTGWASVDRAAAIDYAVAHAGRPNFDQAIKDLAYYFFRLFPEDDAKKLIMQLSVEHARMAVHEIAAATTAIILHVPEDYQRPPDVVARWMATLPVELWKDNIGDLMWRWMRDDADGAIGWLSQLQTDKRGAAIADYCRRADSESAERVMVLGLTINSCGTKRSANLRAVWGRPPKKRWKPSTT